MSRIRSPGYPNISLSEAIDLTNKIFSSSRQNAVDREAAAKDLGYSGLTGQSAKMLSNLAHFDLIERSGKGGVRVTDTAVKILHPRRAEERQQALAEAAFSPGLFEEIRDSFPDGFVSENALRGFLMRRGFATAAVQPALRAYMETYSFLQQEQATKSHGERAKDGDNPARSGAAGDPAADLAGPSEDEKGQRHSSQPERRNDGVRLMDGERVVFVEESGPSQYLKLVASGALDESLLEALEDYVARQKKRLQRMGRDDAPPTGA